MGLRRRTALALDSASIYESPDVIIKAAKLFLDFKKCFGVPHGRINLQPITDDAGVAEQFLNLAFVVFRDLAWIEVIEGRAVVLALRQNYFPAQPGLRAFENQELEQCAIVMRGHAPLAIVIGDGQFRFGPVATMGL
jgi:hypothetical protein